MNIELRKYISKLVTGRIIIRPSILIAITGLYLTVIGCAPAYKDMIVAHQNAEICCDSINQFNYQKLKMGESVYYKVTDKSPAFKFAAGKSFFKAFELPQYSEPYHILINSYAMKDGSKLDLYIFRPHIIMLDKDFKIVRQMRTDAIFLKILSFGEWTKTSSSTATAKATGHLVVTNKNEKYAIVLTTKEFLKGESNYLYTPPGILGSIYPNRLFKLKHSPTGELRLSLLTSTQYFAEEIEKLAPNSAKSNAGQRYKGIRFVVTSPMDGGYRFLNRSESGGVKDGSNFEFSSNISKIVGIGTAFVQSYPMLSVYSYEAPEIVLGKVLNSAEAEHRENFRDAKLKISEVKIPKALCQRIEFSGKSRSEFDSLPIRGYDILCVLHDLAGENYRRIIRIGANFIYGLGEDTQELPPELDSFFKQVVVQ